MARLYLFYAVLPTFFTDNRVFALENFVQKKETFPNVLNFK